MTATKPIEGELVDDTAPEALHQRDIEQPTAMTRYDPSQLLGMAIEKGLDITTLERLMDLQERWEKNRSKAEFFDALARFQSLCPEIPKEKAGYEERYFYAPLGTIERVIKGPMGECGLSKKWSQVEGDNDVTMTCTITHVAGHSESSTIGPVKWDLLEKTRMMNGLQQRSAVISYLQRYTVIAVLGLATADEDTDGETPRNGNGKKREEKGEPPQPRVADQIKQPRKINKAQAQQLTEIVTQRGIPSKDATAIVQKFGFTSGAEITVDKLSEITNALNAWQPAEPGGETEQPNAEDKTAQLRKKAENLFLVLGQAGRLDDARAAIDKAAGVVVIEHVQPGDLAAVIAGLEKLGKKK